MNNWSKFAILAVAGLIFLPQPAWADDTEIFTAPPPLTGSLPPANVLIIVDNSANWDSSSQQWPDNGGKQGAAEIAALNNVVSTLVGQNLNVGLMLFTQATGSNPLGGYMRFALRLMNSTNAAAFQSVLSGVSISADKVGTSKTDYSGTMFDAFKYFGGWSSPANVVANPANPAAGLPQDQTHFGPISFSGQFDSNRDYAGQSNLPTSVKTSGNAFASSSSNSYQSPITDPCQKNYIIFIGNGYPSVDSSSTPALNVLGGDPTAISNIDALAPKPNNADEWARFLFNTDVSSQSGQQNVITYTIDAYKAKQDLNQTALLKSMATVGRGRYFAATSQSAIEVALTNIFNEIQSVSGVFATVTLPVSVNVRGTNLNQVYLGVFRNDVNSAPRWLGNLKEYQLALDSNNNLFLADAESPPIPVESTATGFVVDNAISFSTSPSTFWAFKPSGNPLSASDSPDGAVVEKGAAAEVLRKLYASSQSTRPLFTCINCAIPTALSKTAGAATSFDPANTSITQSALNAGSSQERSDIINWVRGTDNLDEDLNGVTTDIRASIHGDVLHSRPAVVNYNRNNDNDDVVVFYGSNDGVIRAIKGGQKIAASSPSSVPSDFNTSGYEKWGFIPQEFFGQFKRLRDNAPAITRPGVPASVSFTATTASGSPMISGLTLAQTAQLTTGMLVSGAGIPAGSLVINVHSWSGAVMISQNATASGSALLTFTSEPKPYFADGPIGVFVCDQSTLIPTPTDLLQRCQNGNGQLRSSDGDIVQIFIPTRRGGRFIYALDVTNPESPSYMWKKGCFTSGGTTTCDAGYQELGQTWSQPTPVKLNISGTITEVLIFGGGYDPMVEDQDPIPASGANSTDTMGRGIFVVDATNGNIIWQAGPVLPFPLSPGETFLNVSEMTYSIPSDVSVIDRDRNGLSDRAYVGDTGGNVWRVDFTDPDPSNWKVHKLASLGFAASQTNADRRKFLYQPSVVPASDSNGPFDAVLLGSGDREHPFNGYGDSTHPLSAAVTNRFYMLKDRNVSAIQAFDPAKQCPAANTSQSASFVITDSGASVVGSAALPVFQDLTSTNLAVNSIPGSLDQACGWFITLEQGEKVVGSAVTVAGTTFFNTNKPSPPASGLCTTNLGIAREFAVNYLNAGAVIDNTSGGGLTLADRFAVHPGGGFLPSPVPVVVNLAPPGGSMPAKSIEGICIGTDCKKTPSGGFGARIRTYWYKEIE